MGQRTFPRLWNPHLKRALDTDQQSSTLQWPCHTFTTVLKPASSAFILSGDSIFYLTEKENPIPYILPTHTHTHTPLYPSFSFFFYFNMEADFLITGQFFLLGFDALPSLFPRSLVFLIIPPFSWIFDLYCKACEV